MEARRATSAGGVIFRPAEDGGDGVEVALISVKRGKVWGLPKGLTESGESLEETALREVREETGLNGKILKELGHVEYYYTFKDEERDERVFKRIYFFLMEYLGGDPADHDDEVVNCRWFPFDTAVGFMKYEDELGIMGKAADALKELKYI